MKLLFMLELILIFGLSGCADMEKDANGHTAYQRSQMPTYSNSDNIKDIQRTGRDTISVTYINEYGGVNEASGLINSITINPNLKNNCAVIKHHKIFGDMVEYLYIRKYEDIKGASVKPQKIGDNINGY